MSTAILIAGLGALATRSKQLCLGVQDYYWNGSSYSPAGVFGSDYFCASSGNVCTYYVNAGVYTPCQAGTYTPMAVKRAKVLAPSSAKRP
jgi:hypothetical protein